MRLASFFIAMALSAASTYQSEITHWREQRVAALKADGGWLTVAGLFWLKEGPNTIGTGGANDIVLPAGPATFGAVELHQGHVRVTRGAPNRELKPDSDDVLKVDRLSLLVIQRGGRFGIRLKDPDSEYRREVSRARVFPGERIVSRHRAFRGGTEARSRS